MTVRKDEPPHLRNVVPKFYALMYFMMHTKLKVDCVGNNYFIKMLD
jgi:hypothetical protein